MCRSIYPFHISKLICQEGVEAGIWFTIRVWDFKILSLENKTTASMLAVVLFACTGSYARST
jgi:hypothetical protein